MCRRRVLYRAPGGTVVGGDKVSTVPAASLSTRFQVRGRYVEFDVVAASFAELNHTFTGPPNPLDMTGGVRTPSSRGKHLIIAGWS